MELKDRFVLQELRKSSGFSIPDSVWGQIEREVDAVGVLGLTGSAQQIVSSLVLKHGEPGRDKDYGRMHPEGSNRATKKTPVGRKKPGREISTDQVMRSDFADEVANLGVKKFNEEKLTAAIATRIAQDMKSTTVELRDATFVALPRGKKEETIILDSGKEVDIESPEGDALVRRLSVEEMMSSWSESSGENPLSVSLQDATKEEFGLKGSADMYEGGYKESAAEIREDREERKYRMEDYGSVYRDFVRTQYDQTQEMLKRRNISEITVYRGYVSDTKKVPKSVLSAKGEPVSSNIQTRPLSSWSTYRVTAESFAEVSDYNETGLVFSVVLKASSIMSTPVSGFGNYTDSEIVTVGSSFKTKTYEYDWVEKSVDSSSNEVMNVDDNHVNADWIKSFRWDDSDSAAGKKQG